MNRTARETKLGRLLCSQQITNESELALFVANNFSNNLFDYRDYEDTIEYFRENIKSFDYNRILNNIASQPFNSFLSFSCIDGNESSSEENETHSSSSVSSSTSSLNSVAKKIRTSSLSTDSSEHCQENFDLGNRISKEKIKKKISKHTKSDELNEKSYLRIIYDWLKGNKCSLS